MTRRCLYCKAKRARRLSEGYFRCTRCKQYQPPWEPTGLFMFKGVEALSFDQYHFRRWTLGQMPPFRASDPGWRGPYDAVLGLS